MSRFSHTPEQADRAQQLRRDMTKAERRLWNQLRGSAMGAPFRRQHPIGPYFADFCCVPLKIVVELDGSQHVDRAAYDARRTAYLEAQGFAVLRFWNADVIEGMDGVLPAIGDLVRKRQFELR